jgi:hypothetical protein
MLDVSDRIVYIRDGDIAKIDTRADLDLNIGSADLMEDKSPG